MSKKKPCFNLDEDDKKPVTAGGVLFYRKGISGDIELLLVHSRGQLEDLGGRVDEDDESIYDAVSREVKEESNKMFSKHKVLKRVKKCKDYIYMPKSKYVVYILKAGKKESKYVSDDFGDREIHDDIARTINWVPLKHFLKKEIIEHKLNWRLKSRQLFDKLKQIQSSLVVHKSVFSSEEKPKKD